MWIPIKTIRYEPDPIELEPVPGDPLAFWDGLGVGILLASIGWLTLIVVVVLR
jgi:hypothetical protein